MHVPDLTLRLLKLFKEFLANFKSEHQCSGLNLLGTKRYFPSYFLHFPTTALHLPRRCRLVSYSSPQRGHIGHGESYTDSLFGSVHHS